MNEVLTIDSQFKLPDFTLVSASAGCGKTTALTHRFIQILLSERISHNGLRNILAITFTNNAAAEMKQRILEYLKLASLGDHAVIKQLQDIISLDENEIKSRAGALVDVILEHYSDFQVETIDSFLSRILKVSTLEFGLPHGFEIVLNSGMLVDEAFAVLMNDIAANPSKRHVLELLVELLQESRIDREKFLWDPFENLANEIKGLYQKLSAHTGQLVEQNNSNSLISVHQIILQIISAIGDMAEQSGFTINSNYQKIIAAARAGDIGTVINKKVSQNVLNKSKGPLYDAAAERIERLQDDLVTAVNQYIEVKARTYYQPYVQTYTLLREAIEMVQHRNGEVSLNDAVKTLAQSLSDEAVPEIYFSLGERIHHYLIDEFQDTSPIQWATLRPLIENSLAQQGSLFIVGDTKQSIYSFRGGDWQIMGKMMTVEEFPSVVCQRRSLLTNYRSTEAIVEFTKEVFQKIVPKEISPTIADKSGLVSFKQNVQQAAKGKGYVGVYSFDDGSERHQATELPEKQKVIDILKDCSARGYQYHDMAILTPKNNHVIEVSRWLNEAGIKFISHSSLDIRTRSVTGEILALLRFLDSPIDDLSFATFILGDTFQAVTVDRGTIDDVREYLFLRHADTEGEKQLYADFRSRYPEHWEAYFEKLFTLVGYLPLYDLVSQLYATFDLMNRYTDEQGTLIKFLEVIKAFENTGTNSLKEFLVFAEKDSEDADWDIDVSEGEDAVKIMTVHKAKGLGFRVLIVLLYDGVSRPDNIFISEADEGIRLIRITKDWADRSQQLSEIYEASNELRQVDELNKLYVALTRAREEMYILTVKAKRGTMPSLVLPEGGYTQGRRSPALPGKEETERMASLIFVCSPGLKQSSNVKTIGFAETQRGEFIHGVLSRVYVLQDDPVSQLQEAIESVRTTMEIEVDLSNVRSILEEFLSHSGVLKWFVPLRGRVVLNEQEIVAQSGRLYRIDRLVVDKESISVIDFKTGGEHNHYRNQVLEYMDLVRDLYPDKTILGFLAYVDLNLIREVR